MEKTSSGEIAQSDLHIAAVYFIINSMTGARVGRGKQGTGRVALVWLYFGGQQ